MLGLSIFCVQQRSSSFIAKVYDVDSFLGAVAYIVEYGYVDQGVLQDSFTRIDTLILT